MFQKNGVVARPSASAGVVPTRPPAAARDDDDSDDDSEDGAPTFASVPSKPPVAAPAAAKGFPQRSVPVAAAPAAAPPPARRPPSDDSESDAEGGGDEGASSSSEEQTTIARPPAAAPAPAKPAAVAPTAAPVSRTPSSSAMGRVSSVPSSLEERIEAEWEAQAAMAVPGDDVVYAHDPPPPEGSHLDRFGFTCDGPGPAPPLSKEEAGLEATRLAKWLQMGVAAHDQSVWKAFSSAKIKERCRKGVPNQLRASVWARLSGSKDLCARNRGLYDALLERTSASEPEIIRDVARTFPRHIHFTQRAGLGQQQLFRVLKAYANYDEVIGYAQGCNFVAAIMLMYCASEEEAFWLFVAIMKGANGNEPLEGLFVPGLPLVRQCLYLLDGLIMHAAPKLGAHLRAQGADPTMYATQWFVTLFSYSLPFDIVLRIWDVYMCEGIKVIFRVSLTLLLAQQGELMRLEFDELIPALKRTPNAGKASADAMMEVACALKVSVELERLLKLYQPTD